MFINTTPHTIGIKRRDGEIFVVEQTERRLFFDFFRCESSRDNLDPLVLENGEVNLTAPAAYTIDTKLFQAFCEAVDEIDGPVYFLVSTIAGETWKKSGLTAPPNCRFFVPYSGPDPSKCHRVNGNPVWTTELMEFT